MSFSVLKMALIARWTYSLLILTSSYYSWTWYHDSMRESWALTKLNLLTGKGAKHREIDICERMKDIGRHTYRANTSTTSLAQIGKELLSVCPRRFGWLPFSLSLSLDDNDPIVETISRLGEGPISMSTDDVSETTPAMPASVISLKTFVCRVYALKSSTRILSEPRWELLRANNLENEMLPPTVGTMIPSVKRVNCYAHAIHGLHFSASIGPESRGWCLVGERAPTPCIPWLRVGVTCKG